MAKYLFASSYTKEGLAAIRSAGAQARVDVATQMIEAAGGSVEAFYFAFGDVDAYVIVDLPDDETAAAVAVAVNSSASVSTRTTKLLTAGQIDAANAKAVDYRPPGS